MPYAILVVLLVALDQVVKYLVRANIPLYGSVDFIPHVLGLTYIQNTGGAFSSLSHMTWLLTLVSAVMTVVLIAVLAKGVVKHPFGRVTVALVLAGAAGNLIDRALFGYVTDMFNVLFMHFAVFNVADICIVVGGVLFCVYFLFFYDKCEKKGKDHGNTDNPV